MNIAVRKPRMTRDQFFAWAQADGGRWEFDGFEPAAMTGGTVNHSQIALNIHAALRSRLRDSGCSPLGPGAGLATIGDAVRYPDALVTCTKVAGDAHVVPGVIVAFEVLSLTSGRVDRIVKLREYRAVPSIRHYVILEHSGIGLTVFSRDNADQDWTATALTVDDTLHLPELNTEIPVTEFYQDVEFPGSPEAA
jgi:Uma2 family endonuclease